jgi:hypothetical protein
MARHAALSMPGVMVSSFRFRGSAWSAAWSGSVILTQKYHNFEKKQPKNRKKTCARLKIG